MRWTTRGLWRCSLGGKRILTHILVQGVPRATMSVLSRDSRAERVNEGGEAWTRKQQNTRDAEAMEISPEPTCPGHKGNQESLNEDEAGRPMRTLIYFIFLSYFISVTSDTAQQQVYPERIPRARRRAWVLWRPPGACSRLLS